jgi:PAS domain S-box-containing protein
MTPKKKADKKPKDHSPIPEVTNPLAIVAEQQDHEQTFRTLVDSGQALIWTSGTDHVRNYFNSVWLEFTGHTLDQEAGNGWINGIHPADLQRCLDTYSKASDRLEKFSLAYRLLRHDGEHRWILDAGCPRHDSNGEFIGYIGHCLDITEHRRLGAIYGEDGDGKDAMASRRDSEAQFREVLEHSLDASYKRNLKTNSYEYLSPVFTRISGYSPDEIRCLPIKTVIDMIHPDDRPEIERMIAKSMTNSTGEPYQVEYRFRHKDGRYRWFLDRFTVLRDGNGQPSARIGSVGDISDRKDADQKLVDILKEQQVILDTADVGISKVVKRIQVWVNRKTIELFQYSKEEMEGQTTRKLYPSQEAYEKMGKDAYPALAQGQVCETEQKLIRRDGTPILVRYIGKAVDTSDMSKGTIWLLEDITERKNTERELSLSEERFRKLFEDNVAVQLIIEPDTGKIIDANRAAEKFYGWSLQELRQMRIQGINALPPEEVEKEMKNASVSGALRLGLRHRRADGSIRDVEVSSSRIGIQGKDLLYSIIHDVSGKKLAEKALRESEERYRKVFENHLTAICIFELETFRIIDVNETHIRLYGYRREELLEGMTIYDLTADKEASKESLRIALSQGLVFVPLRYHKKKDGTIFPVEIAGEPFWVNGRHVMFWMVRDITERKRVENLLLESKAFNLAILNSLSATIAVLDSNGVIKTVNESWRRFALENSSEPGIPAPFTDIGINYLTVCRGVTGFETLDALKSFNGIRSVLDGSSTSFCLEYACHSSIQDRWFSMNVTPLGSRYGGVVVAHTDITERKQSEMRIQKSEERLRAAAKAARFGVYSYDYGKGQANYSPEFMALYGLPPDVPLELDIDLVPRALHPDDKPGFLACMKAANDHRSAGILEHEYRIIRSDGLVRWLRVIGQTVFSSTKPYDQPLHANGIIQDITEARQAKEALKRAHEDLEQRVLERTSELEKTNATLSMMLDYARKAETDIQERVVANLRTTTLQLLDTLKKQQLSQGACDLVELLEKNTQNLAHPLARKLESLLFRLTARELQVANFIRLGKSTKDIMQLLNISFQTVESHRNNLRKKLGLRHKKINLRTYLNSEFAQ